MPLSSIKETRVTSRPDCDLCKAQADSGQRPKNNIFPAHYDGRTRMGPWAYMCQAHFQECGVGLGLGIGQRLIVDA